VVKEGQAPTWDIAQEIRGALQTRDPKEVMRSCYLELIGSRPCTYSLDASMYMLMHNERSILLGTPWLNLRLCVTLTCLDILAGYFTLDWKAQWR
jgi:hypothetical protein